MRPIVRGIKHQDNEDNDIQLKEYSDARGELITRLGEYCSYCEMHSDSSLAVEHIKPKQPHGASTVDQTRALDWNNFLLACANCNSTKGDTEVTIDDYFWPDRDNTFRAFKYSEGGLIASGDQIPDNLKTLADATIQLTGLDKQPANDPKASDRRWFNRKEAWEIAQRAKDCLSKNNIQDVKNCIIDTAKAKGFWSIWMTVFKDDPDMLCRLIDAFPGTCKDCFESDSYEPIPRQGGRC